MPGEEKTCPDCWAGKHDNCTGAAWDNEKDEPTACACWEHGHNLHMT